MSGSALFSRKFIADTSKMKLIGNICTSWAMNYDFPLIRYLQVRKAKLTAFSLPPLLWEGRVNLILRHEKTCLMLKQAGAHTPHETKCSKYHTHLRRKSLNWILMSNELYWKCAHELWEQHLSLLSPPLFFF